MITKAQGDVTADLLKRMGMNVDFVATDWGNGRRSPRPESAAQPGRLDMFHTWHAGADCMNPAVYIAIRGTGDKAWFGWPNSPAVEREVAAWFEAKNLDEEKAAVARLNKAALEDVIYAPTGFSPELHGLAQERIRYRKGTGAVLLGRVEDRVALR